MAAVLDLLKPEIEKTIVGLDAKFFEPDPIAGPHFSKITSVMSSAYNMAIFWSVLFWRR